MSMVLTPDKATGHTATVEVEESFEDKGFWDPYEIVAAGQGILEVPFLVASCPAVDDITVTATQTVTDDAGASVSLLVFGTGAKASAKVTVASGYALACAAGESAVAAVRIPVRWEKRARTTNEDDSYVRVEPTAVAGPQEITCHLVPGLSDPMVTGSTDFDQRQAGSLPFTVDRTETLETGLDFTIGFTNEVMGIVAELTITRSRTVSIQLETALPRGHRYRVSWLGGPPGVAVATL